MRLMCFNAKAMYAPGKTLAVADALSRGPAQSYGNEMSGNNMAAHLDSVLSHVPASEIRDHTATDHQVQAVRQFVQLGWSDNDKTIPESVRDFYKVREELTEVYGLVVRGNHIVMPTSMRTEI